MSKVSVIIPACNEKFLGRTVTDLLEKARGDIEVLVYLDGKWADKGTCMNPDPRVILLHSSVQRGMNNALNSLVNLATGEYIMKLDAHCIVDEGFDVKLAADCEDNWLVVPRRYSLDDEKWERGPKVTDYMYISTPNRPPEPPTGEFWERGFHGVRQRVSGRDDVLVDDLMSFQGSCYFMPRKLYLDMDGLDRGYFWHEAQQIGVKVWLSGGRCVRNKKTWYAHLHKGKKHGRGYYLSRSSVRAEAHTIIDLWMKDGWPKQTRTFRSLVEQFNPPGWENWDWSIPWTI